MIAGFSVLSLALDAQTDIVKTQRIVSDIEIKKQQEKFGISASTYGNNILNMSINNQGQNPVEISSIWITNKTLPDQPATRYEINYDDAYVPSGFKNNVLLTQPLEIVPDTYDIKVISAFGTIKTIEFALGSVGSSGLRAEIITDPPDVIIGQNVTIAMLVTNTGSEPVNDVRPDDLVFATTGSSTFIGSPANPIPAYADLNGGASVMFTWDYQVIGVSGEELTFSSIARGNGGEVSGMVSDISILREPTDGGTGGPFDPDIVNEGFYAKPQLFFTIPSPQGDSGDNEALWSVNVVNPIDAQMKVSKLVITAFAPGANDNNKIFHLSGGDCDAEIQMIVPTTGWSCPTENVIMWQNQVTPITIPANSTLPFMIKLEPGKPAAGVGVESIIVQSSVFTTLGSFGKAGYQTAMSGVSASIANVYLSDAANSRDNANIKTSRIGILPDNLETFNIVFADMDNDATTTISDVSRLIINMPKEWTDVQVLSSAGFDAPTKTTFGDGSTQIDAKLSSFIGDGAIDARTIIFEARSPDVTRDELYVMYVLAQGTTLSPAGFSVGPLSEIVLQVNGD
jgi:hypothetical protein